MWSFVFKSYSLYQSKQRILGPISKLFALTDVDYKCTLVINLCVMVFLCLTMHYATGVTRFGALVGQPA